MKNLTLIFILSLILFSCVSLDDSTLRQNSFTDPDYQNILFNKILIQVDIADFAVRKSIENVVDNAFKALGISSIPSYTLFLPTRNYTDDEKSKILSNNEINATLLIKMDNYGYSKTITSDNETIEKPYMNINLTVTDFANGKTAWICSGFNGGNAYESLDEIMHEFFEALAQKIIDEKIVSFKYVPKTVKKTNFNQRQF